MEKLILFASRVKEVHTRPRVGGSGKGDGESVARGRGARGCIVNSFYSTILCASDRVRAYGGVPCPTSSLAVGVAADLIIRYQLIAS